MYTSDEDIDMCHYAILRYNVPNMYNNVDVLSVRRTVFGDTICEKQRQSNHISLINCNYLDLCVHYKWQKCSWCNQLNRNRTILLRCVNIITDISTDNYGWCCCHSDDNNSVAALHETTICTRVYGIS